MQMRSSGVPPGTSLIEGALGRWLLRYALPDQFLHTGPRPFPLSPFDLSQMTTYPAIQFLSKTFGLALAEVVDPASQDRIEILPDKSEQVTSFSLPEMLFDFLAKPLDAALRWF